MRRDRSATSAGDILDRRHPPTAADLDVRASFRRDIEIAEMICRARTDAGLSQRGLARLLDTSASVICRLEDADYQGHSMAMLRRIAEALGQRIEIRFVPRRSRGA